MTLVLPFQCRTNGIIHPTVVLHYRVGYGARHCYWTFSVSLMWCGPVDRHCKPFLPDIKGFKCSSVHQAEDMGLNPRLEGETIVKSWEGDFGESGSSSHCYLCYVMFWSDKDCVRKSAPWLVGIGGASRRRKIKFTGSVGRHWLVPRNMAGWGFETFTCLTSLCWLNKLGEPCWTLTLSTARFWRLNIFQTLQSCNARRVMEHHMHGEALCRVWSC
jgi:predicted metal-binding transcription factor (methanogenesis marker protein 9)